MLLSRHHLCWMFKLFMLHWKSASTRQFCIFTHNMTRVGPTKHYFQAGWLLGTLLLLLLALVRCRLIWKLSTNWHIIMTVTRWAWRLQAGLLRVWPHVMGFSPFNRCLLTIIVKIIKVLMMITVMTRMMRMVVEGSDTCNGIISVQCSTCATSYLVLI